MGQANRVTIDGPFRGDCARRMIKSILASLVVIAAAAPAGFAQKAPVGKPATLDEMNTYMVMGGSSMCEALQQGLAFDKAVQVGAVGFYGVVARKHAYKIDQPGLTKPLTPQQLNVGVVNNTMLAAMSICKDNIPKEIQDQVLKGAAAAKKGAPKP